MAFAHEGDERGGGLEIETALGELGDQGLFVVPVLDGLEQAEELHEGSGGGSLAADELGIGEDEGDAAGVDARVLGPCGPGLYLKDEGCVEHAGEHRGVEGSYGVVAPLGVRRGDDLPPSRELPAHGLVALQ